MIFLGQRGPVGRFAAAQVRCRCTGALANGAAAPSRPCLGIRTCTCRLRRFTWLVCTDFIGACRLPLAGGGSLWPAGWDVAAAAGAGAE